MVYQCAYNTNLRSFLWLVRICRNTPCLSPALLCIPFILVSFQFYKHMKIFPMLEIRITVSSSWNIPDFSPVLFSKHKRPCLNSWGSPEEVCYDHALSSPLAYQLSGQTVKQTRAPRESLSTLAQVFPKPYL